MDFGHIIGTSLDAVALCGPRFRNILDEPQSHTWSVQCTSLKDSNSACYNSFIMSSVAAEGALQSYKRQPGYITLFKMNIPSVQAHTVLWWKKEQRKTSSSPADARSCWLTSSTVVKLFPWRAASTRQTHSLVFLSLDCFLYHREEVLEDQLFISHSRTLRDFVRGYQK